MASNDQSIELNYKQKIEKENLLQKKIVAFFLLISIEFKCSSFQK